MGDSRSVVEGFYDAFNRNDFDAVRAFMTDDIENVDPSGTIRGWEAFRLFIETFKTAAPDSMLNVVNILEDEDRTATEGTYTGTFTGPMRTPMGEVPPTGQRFELPFAEINQIVNGKIASHRVYYDQVTFMAALGITPPS